MFSHSHVSNNINAYFEIVHDFTSTCAIAIFTTNINVYNFRSHV